MSYKIEKLLMSKNIKFFERLFGSNIFISLINNKSVFCQNHYKKATFQKTYTREKAYPKTFFSSFVILNNVTRAW